MDPIAEIKQKIDIVDLIGGYIEIKKAGRNYKAACPFHGEKTPSFMISPELQIYKCFGCGEAGDIFSFHQKIEGIDFADSLKHLAERAHVILPEKSYDPDKKKRETMLKINEVSAKFYNFLLTKHKVGEVALKYLAEKRKLNSKTIEEFNIGYSPDSSDSLINFLKKRGFSLEEIVDAGLAVNKNGKFIDKFRKRIMFPLTGIDGKTVGFTARVMDDSLPKYLNTPETLVFHKSGFIFGLDKARLNLKHEGAVFVEGQMDVISAFQADIRNVMASSGTSLTVGQLKLLSRYTKDITFAFDSDKAGLMAIHRAIELAEKEDFNIKVLLMPKEYKDLDEFVQADGKGAKDYMKKGIPVYDFFLISSMKRNNPTNPIGKKKIMDELVPIFMKIVDPVLKDHYIKKISNEIDVSESVVTQLLNSGVTNKPISMKDEGNGLQGEMIRQSFEKYILAILLKTPLDMAQTVLYKLGQRDFVDPVLAEVFGELKKYLLGRKRKFEIAQFKKKFTPELAQIIDELYLWDLDNLFADENLLERELNKMFDQIKKNTAKRELKELSFKIRQAEGEGNQKLLTELSKQFKELSEKLL